jgi:DNA-directed RNA polymerase subunit RPC12/RpoP
LGNSVKDYLEHFWFYLAQIEWRCPSCGAKLVLHAKYLRKMKAPDAVLIVIITIIRYRCTGCGKTHAILPDFLAPYRRYAMPTIEAAVTAVVEEKAPLEKAPGDQDPATTRRWARRFLGLSEQATSLLGSILLRLSQEFLPLVMSDDGPCGSLRRVLGELPETPATSSFGKANIWLTMDGVPLWL